MSALVKHDEQTEAANELQSFDEYDVVYHYYNRCCLLLVDKGFCHAARFCIAVEVIL